VLLVISYDFLESRRHPETGAQKGAPDERPEFQAVGVTYFLSRMARG
jgi:hypothetical protein